MLNNLFLRFNFFLWSFRRAYFYRNLADSLQRKVGLRDFLERQASNARMLKDDTSYRVVRAMSGRLAAGKGDTLSELVYGIAPQSDQLFLRTVDDASKAKVEAMVLGAAAVEFQQRAIKTLVKELFVPVVGTPIVAVICILTAKIVTDLVASGSADSVWTGFNGVVRMISEFINAYAILIVVSIVAATTALIVALPRWTGPLRLKVENWPAMALYRDYNAAIVLSALAMMLRSGKSLREALQALRQSGTPWLRWHLARILASLDDNPSDYDTAFGRGLMPVSVRARLAELMDSVKSFGDAMVELGTKEVGRLEERVQISAKALGWALLVGVGSIGVTLSIGLMTITTGLSDASNPTAKLMERAQRASPAP